MFIFGLRLTSNDQPGWLMDLNPIQHPSPAPKNEMLIFGLHSTSDDQPSNPSNESCPKYEKMAAKLSKNEILIFGLHSTSDDRLGWLMDSNPICHPSPAL